MKSCTPHSFCSPLLRHSDASWGRGLTTRTIIHMPSGKVTRRLIVYKHTKAAVGIALNFCPFCGVDYQPRFEANYKCGPKHKKKAAT